MKVYSQNRLIQLSNLQSKLQHHPKRYSAQGYRVIGLMLKVTETVEYNIDLINGVHPKGR